MVLKRRLYRLCPFDHDLGFPYWARGAILNPGAQFRKFQKQGQNLSFYATRGTILGPPGAGFFSYVSPGGWSCQVMHSGRLAHASSLTYRFWGDASREESLFGTPRARRHPKKCEASPQRLRGVTPKMEGWPLTSFLKITIFQKQTS